MVSSSRRDGSEVKFEDTKNRKNKSYSTIEYADLKKKLSAFTPTEHQEKMN